MCAQKKESLSPRFDICLFIRYSLLIELLPHHQCLPLQNNKMLLKQVYGCLTGELVYPVVVIVPGRLVGIGAGTQIAVSLGDTPPPFLYN